MVHPPTPAGTQICSTGRAVVANFDPMLSLTPVEWNHPLRVIDAIKLSQSSPHVNLKDTTRLYRTANSAMN
jgi:hypothetical protein